MGYEPDWVDKISANAERRTTLVSPSLLPYFAGGAVLLAGGLALKTASLKYPTSNLGGYATMQTVLPSCVAGVDLSHFVKQLGGPVPALLGATVGVLGAGVLLSWMFSD